MDPKPIAGVASSHETDPAGTDLEANRSV